jgi:signal transduction histidine kinase
MQRLIRGFSHDLKNPLGAADGYAELLTSGVYGALLPPQKESVERIRRSIHNAIALIDDLHVLASAETSQIPLSPEPVNLCDLLIATAEEYRAVAAASRLTLSLDVGPDLEPVETDPARVRQIIGNLLSNAIKYTETGSVTLRIRSRTPSAGAETDAEVAIEVIDTGPGIPADKHEIIFEEFVRLGTGDKPGLGLGLAISIQLARALGGRITVQSGSGAGSVFTLSLPSRDPPRSLSLGGGQDPTGLG